MPARKKDAEIRGAELARFRDAADAGSLTTLVGPPGSGKTWLLERWKETSKDFLSMSLEGAATEADVFAAFARLFGLPPDATEERTRVVSKGKRIVIDASMTVHDALRRCIASWGTENGVRWIVACHAPFDLPGETIVEVGPLKKDDALALFRSVAPLPKADETAVRTLLDRVDRLPLGIQIIAAWTKILPVGELLRIFTIRLPINEEVRSPYTSLFHAMEGVWAALTSDEQDALRVLSTFRVDVPLDALERMLGTDPLLRLEPIRKRGLGAYHPQSGRFRLHSVVRAFVEKLLAEDPEREAKLFQKHADGVLRAIEEMHRSVLPTSQTLDRLESDASDLRAIADRFPKDSTLVARTLLAIHPLAFHRGPLLPHFQQLQTWVRKDETSQPVLAFVLGESARRIGDVVWAEQALQFLEHVDAPTTPVRSARLRAWVLRTQGKTVEAARVLELAREDAEKLGDSEEEALLLADWGFLLLRLGQPERARDLLEVAKHRLGDTGFELARSMVLSHLGVAWQRLGEPEHARACHDDSLALHRLDRNVRFIGADELHLGFVAVECGEHSRARSCFLRAEKELRAIGDTPLLALLAMGRARLALDQVLKPSLGPTAAPWAEVSSFLVWIERTLRDAPSHSLLHDCARMRGHLFACRGAWGDARDAYRAALELEVERAQSGVDLRYYLALAEKRLGVPFSRIEAAAPLNPLERVGESLLSAELTDAPIPEVGEDVRGRSFELRLILRLLQSSHGHELLVGSDGAWFQAGAKRVDLTRRPSLRRLLEALVEAHRKSRALTLDELVAIGWPGDRAHIEAARKRAYTAIWTLRSLGLECVLDERGYSLAPGWNVRTV